MDVKLVLFFGCVVRLFVSLEAGLGRLVSDCIVASKVWGGSVDVIFFSGASCGGLRHERLV